MKIRDLMVPLLVIVVALGGCAWLQPEPELSPQEVVTKFYRWYIGYPGNPLVDREYRESPYLAESFIEEVDETLEGEFMAVPILLSQDIPGRFTVEQAQISEEYATVLVLLYWAVNSTPVERQVDLQLIEGEWKITDVSMEL